MRIIIKPDGTDYDIELLDDNEKRIMNQYQVPAPFILERARVYLSEMYKAMNPFKEREEE